MKDENNSRIQKKQQKKSNKIGQPLMLTLMKIKTFLID